MTKLIDVSDEAGPLPKGYDFPAPGPELLDPDAPVFDAGPVSKMDLQVVGLAPKPRDPADVLMILTFLSRHGLRLIGFFPQVRTGRFLCDGSSHGFRRTGPRPLGAEKCLTRVPPRAVVTKGGARWVTPSEEKRLRYYTPVPGEAAYAAQERILQDTGVYEDRLSVQSGGMSLADDKYSRLAYDSATDTYRPFIPNSQKLPKEGVLPERSCGNPECLGEIKPPKNSKKPVHHNIQYCGAKCTARAKELRRLDRKNQKAKPILYRNELGLAPDLTSDTSQLETGFISPHIGRGIVSNAGPNPGLSLIPSP